MHFKRVFARKIQICRDEEDKKETTSTILPESQEVTKTQDSTDIKDENS